MASGNPLKLVFKLKNDDSDLEFEDALVDEQHKPLHALSLYPGNSHAQPPPPLSTEAPTPERFRELSETLETTTLALSRAQHLISRLREEKGALLDRLLLFEGASAGAGVDADRTLKEIDLPFLYRPSLPSLSDRPRKRPILTTSTDLSHSSYNDPIGPPLPPPSCPPRLRSAFLRDALIAKDAAPQPPAHTPKIATSLLDELADIAELDSQRSETTGTKKARLLATAASTALNTPSVIKIPHIQRHPDGSPVLPLTVGAYTVHSLGKVHTASPQFHTDRYIFPVGYECVRQYFSTLHANTMVNYTCRIGVTPGSSLENDAPRYEIEAQDRPGDVFHASTSTGVWSQVVRLANQLKDKTAHSNSVSGPDYYGFTSNVIKCLIQELDGASSLKAYKFQAFQEDPNLSAAPRQQAKPQPRQTAQAGQTGQTGQSGQAGQTGGAYGQQRYVQPAYGQAPYPQQHYYPPQYDSAGYTMPQGTPQYGGDPYAIPHTMAAPGMLSHSSLYYDRSDPSDEE